MSFRRYEDYRQSGLAWVGELPTHWHVRRLKTLFARANRPPGEGDQIVTAFRDGRVTLRANRREEGFTNSLQEIGYQGVRRGDLVIHAMDAFAGAIGVSDSDGKSTPVYSACVPWEDADAYYYALLLRHMALSGFVTALARGVRERSTEFRWADASVLPLPHPPLQEQRAIVRFLDRETAKIDALVEEQRRLIELLKEKRQAVISHAVTKGLDPSAPMKDSGVEWLGEVPDHWQIRRFSRAVMIAEGQVDPREEPYSSMILIAPNHVESQTGRLLALETAAEQGADSGKYLFSKGDVIYSKIRPALAKAALAPTEGLCSADMYPLRGREGMGNEYLKWLLLCPGFTAWAVLESERVAMPKINREKLGELRVPTPPPHEQERIARHIEQQVGRFDGLVAEAEAAIRLLHERRAALISAAVTGKIDVRDRAAAPAELEPA